MTIPLSVYVFCQLRSAIAAGLYSYDRRLSHSLSSTGGVQHTEFGIPVKTSAAMVSLGFNSMCLWTNKHQRHSLKRSAISKNSSKLPPAKMPLVRQDPFVLLASWLRHIVLSFRGTHKEDCPAGAKRQSEDKVQNSLLSLLVYLGA